MQFHEAIDVIGECIEPFIDDGESLIHLRFEIALPKIENIDFLFDPVKPLIYPIKALFDSIKALFDSVKPLFDSIKPLFDSVKPIVDAIEPMIDSPKTRANQTLDGIDSIRHCRRFFFGAFLNHGK